jgi:hypothetical protein
MAETNDHILCCTSPQAILFHESLVLAFLSALEKIGTREMPMYIFGLKLLALLHMHNPGTYQPHPITDPMLEHTLITAITHQNISGWENFLKGYISHYWQQLQMAGHTMDPQSLKVWEQSLTTIALSVITNPSGITEIKLFTGRHGLTQGRSYANGLSDKPQRYTGALQNSTHASLLYERSHIKIA